MIKVTLPLLVKFINMVNALGNVLIDIIKDVSFTRFTYYILFR